VRSYVFHLLALSAVVVACGSGDAAPPVEPVPDDPVPTDKPFFCPESGISKGPWALGMTETGIKIRWEACRAALPGDVTATPEGGGAPVAAKSVETSFVVNNTYRALDKEVPPDSAGTYFMNEVTLTGLAPSTCYQYALAADASVRGRFCTARANGDRVHFLAIGDTNPLLGRATGQLIDKVVPLGFDFIIHGGDIQYYASTLETWAAWFPVMAPLLRASAMQVAIGNHEYEKPDEMDQYTLRFFGGSGSGGTDTHYRFQSGGVWFFSINTEDSTAPESEQGKWLAASLDEVSALPGYRFSVVYFHKPWVTCGPVSQNSGARNHFAPIFALRKVPLVFQAHVHGYERFVIDGVSYITAGGGGAALHDLEENASRMESASRVAHGKFFHAVDVTVNATQISARVIDETGAERDAFTLPVP
jgi:hypothetical protein